MKLKNVLVRGLFYFKAHRDTSTCLQKPFMYVNHLGVLFKCRFRFTRSEMRPKILHF